MVNSNAKISAGFHHTRFRAFRQYAGQILPPFLFGLLCSLAALPFGLAPFGVAAAAVRTNGKTDAVSLYAGALAGYAVGGLARYPYMIGVLITPLIKLCLSRLLPRRRTDVAAVACAAVALSGVYLILAAQYRFLIFDVVTGAAAVLLGTGFAYFSERAAEVFLHREIRQTGLTQNESVGVMLVVAVLLLPLTRAAIYDVSPARAAGVFFVLLTACYGRSAQGAMCGVITGVILSLGRPDFTHVIAAYALAGLVAGLCPAGARVRAAFAFMLANATITLYLNNSIVTLISLSEVACAGCLFCILPARAAERAAAFLLISPPTRQAGKSARLKQLVLDRLRTAADAFRDAAAAVGSHAPAPSAQPADVYAAANDAAEKVCKNCRLSSLCWSSRYNDTADVFNRMARSAAEKGEAHADDLPEYFNSRCLCRDQLLTQFNLSAAAAARSEPDGGAARSRRILAAQYKTFGSYINNVCGEISKLSRFDENTERRVRQFFLNIGASKCETLAYRDKYDALCVEVDAALPRMMSERKITAGLSDLCGCELAVESAGYRDGVYSYRFCQREKLSLQVASAQRNKAGEDVCGDSFSAFQPARRQKVLALSDGMGSGAQANRVSRLALDVLQRLLECGFEPEDACGLVNDALLLSCAEQSFSTLDLARVNLFSGKADFYKMGAAPTLILRDGKAYEVSCRSLPAGLMDDPRAEHRSCRLREGDVMLMLSDGVDVTPELLDYCRQTKGRSLSDLCSGVLELSCRGAAADDVTVAAARVCGKNGA